MNLYKAIGSIGGLTMVSRVLGFARDMIGSRVLGASHANDAFNLAFLLPNIFRRLFAEGAFSAGFVPLFSRRLASRAGPRMPKQFSNEILSVFMPALLLVTIVFEIFMPGVLLVVAGDYQQVPGKFDLAVELTRWTFPYLLFISLVALLSGVLNSLTRFAIAAFAPALLNVALIVALLVAPPDNDRDRALHGDRGAARRHRPVRSVLGRGAPRRGQAALRPAADDPGGARAGRPDPARDRRGRRLPDQPVVLRLLLRPARRRRADQCSAMPTASTSCRLSIIGTALGVAILPAISQAIARDDEVEAADVQARAFDLSMLLTLPATLALAVAAVPIIGALFQGGEYSVESARITGNILAILVTGLPAYVLVKVLTPAFYARKDVKTPVRIAMTVLGLRRRRQLHPHPGDGHLQPRDGHLGQRVDQFRLAVRHPLRARPFPHAAAGWSAASPGN